MPVNSTHADYDASALEWSRARDVLAGEDAVKAEGVRYLARLDSQSDEEYGVYKGRASFFGATARTLEEYLDLVFRRAPVLALGTGERLEKFAADCDLWGLEFLRYARRVVGEVLAVGRGGSLVLWEQSGRPVVSFWKAEDIANWKVERVGQAPALVELVLRDAGRIRVLRLVESSCVQEFWNPPLPGCGATSPASACASGATSGDWVLSERVTVKRDGVPLSFIPFVFHGPRNSRPEPDRLPLAEIIAANLDHYRLDADYKHGLHFAALPTAWVSGFDKATPLRIGSSAAWVSDIPGATAGFLEFSGAGLAYIERAMERVERRMASLGARMLEGTGVPATGPAAPTGGSGELCGLGSVVASLNQSLTRVLRLAHWWVEGGQAGDVPGVGFTMNTDLSARAISGEEITAVVAAWRSGAISRETMLARLKRGEVLPEGRTVAQERALIYRIPGVTEA
jgi:hypothetical protein